MVTKGIVMNLKTLYPIIFLPFILVLFGNCSLKKADNPVKSAIKQAHLWLTDKNCDKALESLDAVGFQKDNTEYLQVYASSYACKADYNTVALFENELPNFTFSETGLFSSLAAMEIAMAMESPEDPDFVHLQEGIDTLIQARRNDTLSHDERADEFGTSKAENMSIQAFYMVIVAMGRWFQYYGNADEDGRKGRGDGNNTCLLDYDDTDIIILAAIPGPSPPPGIPSPAARTGSCDSHDAGHDELSGTSDEARSRQCQGIVLFNNFLDIIRGIAGLFVGEVAEEARRVVDLFDVLVDNCENADLTPLDPNDEPAGLGLICTVRDQTSCETDTGITHQIIQRYYVYVFERLFLSGAPGAP